MCAWCHVSGEVPTGVTVTSYGGILPLPTLVDERKPYSWVRDLLRLTDPNNSDVYLLLVSTLHYTLELIKQGCHCHSAVAPST